VPPLGATKRDATGASAKGPTRATAVGAQHASHERESESASGCVATGSLAKTLHGKESAVPEQK